MTELNLNYTQNIGSIYTPALVRYNADTLTFIMLIIIVCSECKNRKIHTYNRYHNSHMNLTMGVPESRSHLLLPFQTGVALALTTVPKSVVF